MTFTDPYRQHNYMGEHASDVAVAIFVQDMKWDTNGDGTGIPQVGMWYFDTTLKVFKGYTVTGGIGWYFITNPESNIFYVGKHGSDDNEGDSISDAFLTFAQAITDAVAGDVITCFDNGVYSESLTGETGVDIFAPNAKLYGSIAQIGRAHV